MLEALLKRLCTMTPVEIVSDPVVAAAEFASLAVASAPGAEHLVAAVLHFLPDGATNFERGLAMGMALVLATEPGRG